MNSDQKPNQLKEHDLVNFVFTLYPRYPNVMKTRKKPAINPDSVFMRMLNFAIIVVVCYLLECEQTSFIEQGALVQDRK